MNGFQHYLVFFEYWIMFPISILIATIAMTFGIGGAVFFAPTFILLFPLIGFTPLTPADAFGAALLTELAGFSSGLHAYLKKKTIDFKTAKFFVKVGVPLSIIGTIFKRMVPDVVLISIFSIVMFSLGLFIWRSMEEAKVGENYQCFFHKQRIIGADGIPHHVCVNHDTIAAISVMGGSLLTGMISVGIGETVVSNLRGRFKNPLPVVAGTSVIVVVAVVLASSVTDIILVGIESIPWTLVMFTVPGVIIGGQIGGKLSGKMKPTTVEKSIVGIFFVIGILMSLTALKKAGVI